MKNKIFLTSVFAVMLACPAFSADIPAGTTTEDCVGSPIDNIAEGTVYYTADWTPNYHEIQLNVNTSANGAATNSSVTPTSLWSIPTSPTTNSNVYTRTGNGPDPDFTFTLKGGSVGDDVLDSDPTGAGTTMTWNMNLSTLSQTHTTDELGGTHAATTSVARPFDGFWRAQTGGTAQSDQFIDEDGELTSAGTAAVASYSAGAPASVWYAHYGDACHTAQAPTLDGYELIGWFTASTDGTQVNNYCVSANTELFAHWRARHYKVTYSCGNDGTPLVSPMADEYNATTNPTGGATYDQTYTYWDVEETCERSGYVPSGWTCTRDDNNNAAGHTDGGIWRVTSNVTCVVSGWTANAIHLSWDSNGGSAVSTPATCEYGTTNGITGIQQPTKLGYTFNGWNIDHTSNP